MKAVAEQRGWNHYHHAHLFAAAAHFAKEFDRPDFHRWMSVAQSMHTNFYDNIRGADEIAQAIDDIEQFVRQLEDVRSSPPRPFTIEDSDDRARIRTLTGTRFEIVAYSPAGFSLNGTPTATYEDAEMK